MRGRRVALGLGVVALAACAPTAQRPASAPAAYGQANSSVALPPPNLLLLCAASQQPLSNAYESARNDGRLGRPNEEAAPAAVFDRWTYNRQDVLFGRTQSQYRTVIRLREWAER